MTAATRSPSTNISAADDRWHCHDCPCSRPRLLAEHPRFHVDLVTEMRFFGVDAKLTRDGIESPQALMLDPADRPTPRLRASVLREELEERLQRLQELESWIKRALARTTASPCADTVAVAIEHLRQAMDALELASQD